MFYLFWSGAIPRHNVWKGLAFVQDLNSSCLQDFLVVIAFYLVARKTCDKKGVIV